MQVTYKYIIFNLFFTFMLMLWVSSAYSMDSTDPRIIPRTQPASIILIEQGYIDWPDQPSAEQQSFNTQKSCPPHFAPYPVIRLSKIAYSENDVLQGFGACVNGWSDKGNHYEVAYLISRKYAHTRRQNNSELWVGTVPGAFTIFDTTRMPDTTNLQPTTHDFRKIGGFYWALYCYPPSIPPPTLPANACYGGEGPTTNPY